MHWPTKYQKISFLGQKLWTPAIKRFIFETPFEGPLLPCETDQAPLLGHFPSDQDEIWCVKAPWVGLDLYQILSRSIMNWPRYRILLFTTQIASSQKGKYGFLGHFSQKFYIFGNKPHFLFHGWLNGWLEVPKVQV